MKLKYEYGKTGAYLYITEIEDIDLTIFENQIKEKDYNFKLIQKFWRNKINLNLIYSVKPKYTKNCFAELVLFSKDMLNLILIEHEYKRRMNLVYSLNNLL